jgi:serine/threonine protein phosphatase PrpC
MIESFGLTHIGYIREHNEDAFLIFGKVSQSGVSNHQSHIQPQLLAVADGMGGMQSGEVASRIALEQCANISLPIDEVTLRNYLSDVVHQAILTYGEHHPASSGLGTTLSGIIFQDNKLLVFHVGDSRIYRYRNGFLKQMTEDDTLVRLLERAGAISAEKAESHDERHILTQCLGGPDCSKPLNIQVEWMRGEPQVGDIFVLCTDGISEYYSLEEIESICSKAQSIREIAENLENGALLRGGKDNLTVIVARLREQSNIMQNDS